MKAGMFILRPLLAETGAPKVGKMVIGTVKGDIHDIGKNLVSMMMEGAGFEVVDLGINNAVEKYMAALEEHNPDILGMSALLTTTMPYMKVVIETLIERGMRDDYIVLVGGAPLKIGPGEVEEVLLGHQHAGTAIVEVEKGLQAVKVIGGAHAGHIGPGQWHAVTAAQLKHQLGFEAALDMQVQLQFRQSGDKLRGGEVFGCDWLGNWGVHSDGSISKVIRRQPLHQTDPTAALLCTEVARQGRLVIKQTYNGVTKIIND